MLHSNSCNWSFQDLLDYTGNKGLFGEIMPSALLANAALGLLCHFVTSFLQCHFDSQNHSHFPFQSKPQA